MIETFLTVTKEHGPFEIKEKSSRFISHIFPINNSEEAEAIVKKMWKQHYDATHICYAYRVGRGLETSFRYNDDGEPNGTAGLPIYNEIKKNELFNILVLSIRYYGGTKLGTGGLQRAYSASAREVLEQCSPTTIHIMEKVDASIEFDFLGTMMHIINTTTGSKILEQNYTEKGVDFVVDIPIAKAQSFKDVLREKSSGKIDL